MKLFEKKNIFKLVLIFLILIIWLLCDIFLSKSIFKNSQFGCFNYEVDYYDLKPNCYSKEQLVKTANFYNVFTDTYGYRYFSKDRKKNKKDFEKHRVFSVLKNFSLRKNTVNPNNI